MFKMVVATDAVYGRLNVNVALNRPTFASTIHNPSYAPSNAVDGNKDTNILNLSCFHTVDQDNKPWWAVDLGAALVVVGVLFTNRGDCCGNVSTVSSFAQQHQRYPSSSRFSLNA